MFKVCFLLFFCWNFTSFHLLFSLPPPSIPLPMQFPFSSSGEFPLRLLLRFYYFPPFSPLHQFFYTASSSLLFIFIFMFYLCELFIIQIFYVLALLHFAVSTVPFQSVFFYCQFLLVSSRLSLSYHFLGQRTNELHG